MRMVREAFLFAGPHRGLHVVRDPLLERHRSSGSSAARRIPSRGMRFMCRLMAAAFLRFRSWVGFS